MQHEVLYGLELGQQNKDALSFSGGTLANVNLWNPVLPVTRPARGLQVESVRLKSLWPARRLSVSWPKRS